MKTSEISLLSKILLFITGLLFIGALFTPIWRFELSAPQYPEGLTLKMFANGLGGDVDIINGLNHYIGMQTLHTENFIEFSVLPYIIGIFALISFLLAIFAKKRKWVLIFFIVFVIFVILTGIDFYRWNYEYGHNLDPGAAIKVPGMAYQPPLIGFKELLNFGAYSIADTGGWLLFAAAILILGAIIKDSKYNKKHIKNITPVLLIAMLLTSCDNQTPQPIKLNAESCNFCRMTISDARFATELITNKGKVYKFDDIHCMIEYNKENKITDANYFVAVYDKNSEFMPAKDVAYLQGGDIKSPMMGNCIAFSSEAVAKQNFENFKTNNLLSWGDLLKK